MIPQAHARPIETERLVLRRFVPDDAALVLAIFNEPSFLRFIGDRKVRTLDGARAYIVNHFAEPVAPDGLGAWLIEIKATGASIGFCTLLRRDWLDAVDLGFALLPAYRSQGYGVEAARALLEHARDALGLRRLAAIASADNEPSAKLLGRLGFDFEGLIQPPGEGAKVKLFAADLRREAARP